MVRIEQNSEPIPGYRLIQRIGSGGFGEVWKAEAPGGLMKAIKVLHGQLASTTDSEMHGLRHAQQELKALKRIQAIRHPYLLSLERYDIVDNRLFIVMELADCNLWERYREHRALKQPGIPRRDLLQYLQESAEVLDMMFFSHQLQHLDVKPQNLFLLHNHVKVADFGLVKELEGLQSAITGGVTPVYAAPETLKGMVTPFCDQYSLAIVYQELLTGTRPFEGVNSTQLVMMHTHGSPNLAPLPPGERAIVGRALAKIPNNRFPSCMDLIQALQSVRGDDEPLTRATSFTAPPAPQSHHAIPEASPYNSPADTPPGSPQPHTDSFVPSSLVYSSRHVQSIPEITGNGCLRPAVVVGLGGAGLRIIRELRKALIAQYGLPANLPNLRALYIDTDPEKMEKIRNEGYYPYLQKDEAIYARLQRSSYYLKPRRHGRPIIEGWFDPQLLYKLPRAPQTCGIRAFGRLALIDHYRTIADKLEEFLLETSHPDTLARADKQTRLGPCTNRPRVYVVAGLGGGTGGGMFIDVAQVARLKLRQLGYADSDVVGIFQLPGVDRENLDAAALANAYAGLRELHHYTQSPRSYSAVFDERDAIAKTSMAPFDRFHCFPYKSDPDGGGYAGNHLRGTAEEAIVTLLTDELFTPLGRAAERLRRNAARPGQETCFHAVEKAAHGWPRGLVHQALSDWLSAAVLTRWVERPSGVFDDRVRAWVSDRWNERGLGAEQLTESFEAGAAAAMGLKADPFVDRETQALQAKGSWFARDPEPAAIWEVVSRLREFLGSPEDRRGATPPSPVETAVQLRTEEALREVPEAIVRVATALMEEPDFRLVGAIAANEMMANTIGKLVLRLDETAHEQNMRAVEAMRVLNAASAAERAKAKGAVLVAAAGAFVRSRLQSLYARAIAEVYRRTAELLTAQHRDLSFCRKQLADVLAQLRRNAAQPLPETKTLLLPFGAQGLGEALGRFEEAVSPEDLLYLDNRLQLKIEKLCQMALEGAKKGKPVEASIQDVVEEESRAFALEKLKDVDFTAIYTARFPDAESLRVSFDELFALAAPAHRPANPPGEFCVLGMPEPLRNLLLDRGATPRFPVAETAHAVVRDEVFVHRECPAVSITQLPQVGPFGEEAYLNSLHLGTSPHARTDVPEWADIESGVELALEL